MDPIQEELLNLTEELIIAIGSHDWERYIELCDPTISAFEPEAVGHLVYGLDFHQYYFQLEAGETPAQSSLIAPHVRVMGDVATVAYVRLTQKIVNGSPITVAMEETRVWQKQSGMWKHVHFHRSCPSV